MPSKKHSTDKKPSDDAASQLPLDLGNLGAVGESSQKLKKGKRADPALTSPGRVERVTSRNEFESAIKALGGDAKCIQDATGTLYRVAFGMTATQLYKEHQVPRGNRDFLPAIIQRIIQVHELVNAEMLRNYTLPANINTQSEVNSYIVVIVKRQTEHTEVFLATFKLFGKGTQLGQRKDSLKEQRPITITTEYGPIEIPVLEVDNDLDIPF